jgi:signal transduction histidine kinase/ligand-binding sensor domain-containing protein
MRAVLRLALLMGFGFPAWLVSAADNSAWSVRTWQSDDGLPNNYVTGLAQTPDGYLWVATYSRPARFDGIRFEEFGPEHFGGQPNQKIIALLKNKSGMWMAMDHGPIAFLDSKTARVFTNNLPDRVVLSLTDDGDDALWVTYRGGAVYRMKDGIVKRITSEDGLPEMGYVCSLARDQRGRIWFAKDGQVGLFRDGRFTTLFQLDRVATRLAASSAGGMWICCGTQVFKYDENTPPKARGTFRPQHAESEPTALLEDHQGGLWIGTSDSGLFHFDGSGFEKIATSHRAISCLAEDDEQNLWVGTDGGGLNRVRLRTVTLETEETGLPFETVQSLCEDRKGTIWATTLNGLVACRMTNGWNTLSANSNWPGGRATCVAADEKGGVWIGTKDHVLHYWLNDAYSSWRQTNGLEGHTIHALLRASNGDLWVGEESPDIVQRLRRGEWRTFAMPPGIRIIRAMAADAAGNVWLGSSKGMLVRITGDTVVDETVRTTGVPVSIRSLQATPDGSLWIAYADAGVGWVRDGHFARLGSGQGLSDENISQIAADERGWLWFGGDDGLFRAKQQELLAVATGRQARVRTIRYGPSEGLSSLQANFGDSPGTLLGRDGRLWMPMRTALAVVDTRNVHEDLNPPRVLIRRVAVDDRTIAFYGGVMPVRGVVDPRNLRIGLRLPARHHRVDFEFTSLNFSAPENIQFRYQLEGFDEDWGQGTERKVSYSRLPAGDYTFRVKACNSDGIWNDAAAELAFTVTPFAWQTWWFRLGSLVLFTAVVFSAARYVSVRRLRLRMRMMEQQMALDKERARIARDLHDDLGSQLTKIVLLSDLEADSRAAIVNPDTNRAQQLSATARQLIQSLDETVWAVNPRNDTLSELVAYVGQFAAEFLRHAGIPCRMDLPDAPPQWPVPAEVRHNLLLVEKEALNNIVRHAFATEVRLEFSVGEDSVGMVIEDNGRGFADAPDGPGADGLQNMRRRMQGIGGSFQIESRPGAGTRIVFSCPLPRRE